MSMIEILLAAEAATTNRAVRRTGYRHRHLARNPFVVAAYNLSGEGAAPLGLCYGTSRKKCTVAIAEEPRNRESRFGAINSFAAALVEYIKPFLVLEEQVVGKNEYRLRVPQNTPQVVVPNRATRDYIGARLGRSLRYLGLGDTHDVPESTQWAGAHLSWLADHSLYPGQSIFLAATELLSQLFVTGQSDFENENLASLLAWIDNDPRNGRTQIDAVENAAYGPVPDPDWEAVLEPLVRSWTMADRAQDKSGKAKASKKIHAIVEPKLREAYEATWQAIERAEGIPVARSVAARWATDTRQWGSHARRCEHGIPRFAKRHDALRAARMLEEWSRALEQLEFNEALDDPLILAELDAAGRCVSGRVKSIDINHREVKAGNQRATQVPIVEISLGGSSNLLVGDSVIWTEEIAVAGEIREMDQRSAKVAITAGHKSGTRVPTRGSDAIFASLDTFGGKSPDDPQAVPWTHKPSAPLAENDAKPVDEVANASDASDDGTPDLSAAELVDLPVVGVVGPDEVPGIVL